MTHVAVSVSPPLEISGLTDIFKAHNKSIFLRPFFFFFLNLSSLELE